MNTKDFMTKTEFIKRDNGSPADDVYLIAMDIGYSSVKVFSPECVAMFPSYAVKDKGAGTAGTLTDDYIRYEDLTTGEKWFVGKMANDGLSDEDTSVSGASLYGRDRYKDPMYRAILETGLGVACMYSNGAYKKKTIYIETGLPARYIGKASPDSQLLIKAFEGIHHFRITIGQNAPMEFRMSIDGAKVYLMAQPMGTLFSVGVKNDHQFIPEAENYFNKNVLIFDGGFGTLDFYSIKSHVIGSCETYDNLGMKRVLEETAKTILEQYNKEISVPAMQKYLERGTFRRFDAMTIATKDEPLSDVLEKSSRLVCQEAINKMLQNYPIYEYDYLVITGGTGAAWFEQMRDYLRRMETLKVINGAQNDNLSSVYANVRGYFMYRFSAISKRR